MTIFLIAKIIVNDDNFGVANEQPLSRKKQLLKFFHMACFVH